MSKLQKLAAARKKKADEKLAQEKIEQTRNQLTDLSVSESPSAKENNPSTGPFSKRLKTSESTAEGRGPLPPAEPKRPETPQQSLQNITNEQHAAAGPGPGQVSEKALAKDKARPSVFAQTLFGSPSDIPKRRPLDFFPLPYATSSVLNAFSKPSPDDVVFAAQAKGSILGKNNR